METFLDQSQTENFWRFKLPFFKAPITYSKRWYTKSKQTPFRDDDFAVSFTGHNREIFDSCPQNDGAILKMDS